MFKLTEPPLFFAKESSTAEVLNDLDKDLVTLYRAVKHHPEELYKRFKFSLVSRAEFEREKQVNAEILTDIQRAARYLYLQKSSFGGHITGQTFGTATTSKPRLNLLTLESIFERGWQRLMHVQIECLDFRDHIPKFDRAHTLFFLDPPYWNILGYKFDFNEQDFLDLRKILKSIKGKFIMSINDTPEIRKIFKLFQIEEVSLKYSVGPSAKSRRKLRTKLLILN